MRAKNEESRKKTGSNDVGSEQRVRNMRDYIFRFPCFKVTWKDNLVVVVGNCSVVVIL